MLRSLARLCVAVTIGAWCCSVAFAADGYRVVARYPHDRGAFTQGLVYVDGHLYESTGINGKSSLREEDLESGCILRFHDVPDKYFAEGLTDWSSTLVQLTWQSHVALVYDRATFRFVRSFPYDGEGWGLTHDARSLILSDGSSTLRFFDPTIFKETRHVVVKDAGKPVPQLNELEYIHGQIYANIWHEDRIARISPVTGKVLGWIDLKGLLPAGDKSSEEAVLNGIAYDAAHDRLFVTGKLWPWIFEIKLIAATPAKPKKPAASKP